MATAREIRAAVRTQLAETMAARQKAALSVASAYAKIEKARERVTAAELEASTALTAATETVPLAELATLSGVPAAELRRWNKTAKQGPAEDTSAPGDAREPAGEGVGDVPTESDGAAAPAAVSASSD